MGKIRKTKTELKSQRDALRRFEKYLPTLELKKQQLRLEVSRMNVRISEKRREKQALRENLKGWIRLFADENIDLENFIELDTAIIETDNIAGVSVPKLADVTFKHTAVDLFTTPPWIDDGLDIIAKLVRLEIEEHILEKALERLSEELRITSQRVNLFEKVKIPQTRENIRIIRIYQGDEQAAAVARAKTAKQKREELGTSTI